MIRHKVFIKKVLVKIQFNQFNSSLKCKKGHPKMLDIMEIY